MNKTVAVFLTLLSLAATGGDETVTNVYARAHAVYEGQGSAPMSVFGDAAGGGILNACSSSRFFSFRDFVSNRCDDVVAEWLSFETNRLVRYTTQCAIGYTCFEMQTNFTCKVLSLYEANTNVVSWGTMEMLFFPEGHPDVEHYLELNYDSPGVSNIISRLKNVAIQRNDEELRRYCDQLFSGELKREYLDMKAAGAL